MTTAPLYIASRPRVCTHACSTYAHAPTQCLILTTTQRKPSANSDIQRQKHVLAAGFLPSPIRPLWTAPGALPHTQRRRSHLLSSRRRRKCTPPPSASTERHVTPFAQPEVTRGSQHTCLKMATTSRTRAKGYYITPVGQQRDFHVRALKRTVMLATGFFHMPVGRCGPMRHTVGICCW